LPLIQQTQDAWAGKGVAVYAVNVGESEAKVKDFLTNRGMSIHVLFDPAGSMIDSYAVSTIPAAFFIDKDGVIRQKSGPFPNMKAIEAEMKKILQ
jgi:peroxiredoxin